MRKFFADEKGKKLGEKLHKKCLNYNLMKAAKCQWRAAKVAICESEVV